MVYFEQHIVIPHDTKTYLSKHVTITLAFLVPLAILFVVAIACLSVAIAHLSREISATRKELREVLVEAREARKWSYEWSAGYESEEGDRGDVAEVEKRKVQKGAQVEDWLDRGKYSLGDI